MVSMFRLGFSFKGSADRQKISLLRENAFLHACMQDRDEYIHFIFLHLLLVNVCVSIIKWHECIFCTMFK